MAPDVVTYTLRTYGSDLVGMESGIVCAAAAAARLKGTMSPPLWVFDASEMNICPSYNVSYPLDLVAPMSGTVFVPPVARLTYAWIGSNGMGSRLAT